jgi:hypothetical protein
VQSEVLSGWKDIANYLRKGVRTVQRYERELSLPVRRPAGKAKGSVIATRSELDAWVASCSLADRPRHPAGAASVLSVCTSLRDRIALMRELAERMKKLKLEVRDSRETVCATIQRIHQDTNRQPSELRRISGAKIPVKDAI